MSTCTCPSGQTWDAAADTGDGICEGVIACTTDGEVWSDINWKCECSAGTQWNLTHSECEDIQYDVCVSKKLSEALVISESV